MDQKKNPSDVRTPEADAILQEIMKDPEVMNTDLIDAAVKPVAEPGIGAVKLLATIDNRFRASKRKDRRRHLAVRVGTLAAAMLVMLGATFGVANALRWEEVLRLFAPLSDLLVWGTPGDNRHAQDIPRANEPDAIEAGDDAQMQAGDFATVEDVLPYLPSDASRTAILALAQQYPFLQGSWYKDAMGIILTCSFSGDKAAFFLEINVVDSEMRDQFSLDIAVEQNPQTEEVTMANGTTLALVQNNDILNGQWSEENAFYKIWGKLDKETLITIIGLIQEGSP